MTVPRWFSVAMGCLALAGWLVHWHLSFSSQTIVEKVDYNRRQMTVDGCRQLRAGEPESVVHSMYGAPPGLPGSDKYTIWVTYDYDMDFYMMGRDQKCDVYYDDNHRVKFVYEELLP